MLDRPEIKMGVYDGVYLVDGPCQSCRAIEDILVLKADLQSGNNMAVISTFRLCRKCWGEALPLLEKALGKISFEVEKAYGKPISLKEVSVRMRQAIAEKFGVSLEEVEKGWGSV